MAAADCGGSGGPTEMPPPEYDVDAIGGKVPRSVIGSRCQQLEACRTWIANGRSGEHGVGVCQRAAWTDCLATFGSQHGHCHQMTSLHQLACMLRRESWPTHYHPVAPVCLMHAIMLLADFFTNIDVDEFVYPCRASDSPWSVEAWVRGQVGGKWHTVLPLHSSRYPGHPHYVYLTFTSSCAHTFLFWHTSGRGPVRRGSLIAPTLGLRNGLVEMITKRAE
jgi:hypothetical protein